MLNKYRMKYPVRFWLSATFLGLLSLPLLLAILMALSIPLSSLQGPQLSVNSPLPDDYVLTNVKVVNVATGEISPLVNVRISQNKIVAIDDETFPGVAQLNAEGRYLMAGLVDAHVHVFDPQDLGLYLAHGVTSVRNMAGMPAHLQWRDAWKRGEFVGARMITTSPALNSGDDMGPFHKRADTPEDARMLVEKYMDEGYDGIKIYSSLSEEVLREIFETAGKESFPVSGHASDSMLFESQLNLPFQTMEHIEEIYQIPLDRNKDPLAAKQVAEQIGPTKLAITTTLIAYHNIYLANEMGVAFRDTIDRDYLTSFTSFVGDRQLSDYWNDDSLDWVSQKNTAMMNLTRELSNAGATLIVATDTGPALTMPGLSYHDELQILSEAGLTNQAILLAATENAAPVMQTADLSGRVEVGSIADLILLDSNPLQDLKTLKEPYAVISNGVYLDEEALHSLKEQGKNHHSFYTVMGWLLDGIRD